MYAIMRVQERDKMPITKLSPTDAREAIQEWTGAVDTLFEQVQNWIAEERAQEWHLSFSTSEVTEESIGSYVIRVMEIDTRDRKLILEPIGYDVLGARGRIDLYAWPSLYRVMLLRSFTDEGWIIRTESGINWPQHWGNQSFLAVAEQLLNAS